jgi:hypothetical protein
MGVSAPPVPRRSRATPIVIGVLTAGLVVAVVAALASPDHQATSMRGSGVAVTQERTLRPFTSVDLAGPNVVRIAIGTPQRVVVFADDNLVARVTTIVRDGTLTVDARGRFESRSPMRVEVTVPRLDAVTLSGSGTLSVAGVDTATFTARLPGSGVLAVSGRSSAVHASIGGSGVIHAAGLTTVAADALLSGTGTIELKATYRLDAAISGTGTIICYGHPPDVTRTTTGSGAIQTP